MAYKISQSFEKIAKNISEVSGLLFQIPYIENFLCKFVEGNTHECERSYRQIYWVFSRLTKSLYQKFNRVLRETT